MGLVINQSENNPVSRETWTAGSGVGIVLERSSSALKINRLFGQIPPFLQAKAIFPWKVEFCSLRGEAALLVRIS